MQKQTKQKQLLNDKASEILRLPRGNEDIGQVHSTIPPISNE